MAPNLRAQLEGLDEDDTQKLMKDVVLRHFDTLT